MKVLKKFSVFATMVLLVVGGIIGFKILETNLKINKIDERLDDLDVYANHVSFFEAPWSISNPMKGEIADLRAERLKYTESSSSLIRAFSNQNKGTRGCVTFLAFYAVMLPGFYGIFLYNSSKKRKECKV